MSRLICLLIGYVCGLLQTGYLYGRIHKIDIRTKGSGNSGSTNVLRVMGPKAGAMVFLGDFLKTLIPCLIVRYCFRGQPESANLMVLYTAFGVILGHNYPFYMGFKGGKGIAATGGLVTAMDIRVALLCLLAFVLVVVVTKYVSLGSLVVATVFLAGMVILGRMGTFGLGEEYLTEFYIVSSSITVLAFWRHRANIKRLLDGTENKVGQKKSETS